MKEICVLTFLGLNSWTDLKKREVSLAAVTIFGAAGLLLALWRGEGLRALLISTGIGGFFLAVSVMTRGAMGLGDGWLLLALGTVLKLEELLTVLFFGLLACAVWAAVLMAVFHKGRNAEIPFVPFLLLGYVGGLLLW